MSRADSAAGLDRLIERKSRLARRAATAPAAGRLPELRAWQAARLERTYADLRRDPLAGEALGFFLSDLYGPQDLSGRDRQVARACRLLKRALPARTLQVLSMAMQLDVLSTELDLEMAGRLPPGPITPQAYAEAYRAVGRRDARRRQIGLVCGIGRALARAVRNPLVGLALRAAHAPAHVAGFGALQDFLERGFAAFHRLPRTARLLGVIERREVRLMEIVLGGGTISGEEATAEGSGPA